MIFYRFNLLQTKTTRKNLVRYGLQITDKAEGKVLFCNPVLSDNPEEIKHLIKMIRENEVSPCHIRDVVEDNIVAIDKHFR